MNKRLFILLTILLTLTLIAACGGGGAAEPAPEAPAEPTPAPAPTKEEAPAEDEEAAGASASDQLGQDAGEAEAPPVEEESDEEAMTAEHAADIDIEVPAGGGEALTAQEAYELALEEALAWQPDPVLVSMGVGLLGPMDAEGRSTNWTLSFWASGANELNTMMFFNGTFNGTPLPNTGFPKPVPAMEQVILDTKQLYDIAAGAGGSEYTAQGSNLMPGLTVYPLDEAVPTWYYNYFDPNDNTLVYNVIIDARSGEVIQTSTP
jgi:predicted small lipoprotein YifL